MPWYICSNLYVWGNVVKAKNYRQAATKGEQPSSRRW